MRRLAAATTGLLTVALLAVVALIVFGNASLVTTRGISMEPRFHSGDLAVVLPATQYGVDDVVAYRSTLLHAVLMHRIVAVEGAHYTLRGDRNSWLDPEHPTASDLVGKLAFRIPQGGIWLGRATSPIMLGLITFGLLATGGTVVQRRRKRARGTTSQHVTPRPHRSWAAVLTTAPQWLRTAAAATAVVVILGLALAAWAWTGPVTKPAQSQAPAGRSMTFSYTASVPQTPAYDGTTVTSPDPVFRALANTVDVHFAYAGNPGMVTVSAVLSTAGGWHSTVPLAAPTTFTTTGYDATVRLDLKALEARAQAAAAVTGLPTSQLTVAVTALVDTPDGARFAPTLPLSLSPLQLALAGDAKALVVKDSTLVRQVSTAPRTIAALGRHITAAEARTLSAILLSAGLLGAVILALIARRSAPASEGAGIRRRYAHLLVHVHPMPAPSGRPLVDVTRFATLARLAERYGLLVLHWSRSGVETFVVQDEGTTYRYRTGAGDFTESITADANALTQQALTLLNVSNKPRSKGLASNTYVLSPAVAGPVVGQTAGDRAGFDDPALDEAGEPSP